MNTQQTVVLNLLIDNLDSYEIEIESHLTSKSDVYQILLYLTRQYYISKRKQLKYKFTTSQGREIINSLKPYIREYVLANT